MPKQRKGDFAPQSGFAPWRAISLWQPLPTLATAGYLDRICLAWGTSYRGPLLMHASMVWTDALRDRCNAEPFRGALKRLGYGRSNPLPTSAIVGVVRVEDCIILNRYDDEEEIVELGGYDFRVGRQVLLRYQWKLGGPSACRPAPHKSHIGLYQVSLEVGAGVVGQAVPSRPGWRIAESECRRTIQDTAVHRE